jgi:hypothetical protein
MKAVLALVFTAGMLAASLARGCEVCVEDRMAATYDHEVFTRALNRGHQVVFTDITSRALTRTEWHLLAWTVQSVRGVMKGSVRISKSPMALSFEIDPKATAAAAAITEINRRMGKQPIRVSLIRTISQQEVAAR